MSQIADLCKRYTDLTDEEISVIEQVSGTLALLANLEGADTFVDCPTKNGDAIVVAEGRAANGPTSYKGTVVGLLAKQENEPAVARTFRLGVATKQMKAVTQESAQVIQSVEPIKCGGRIIGVLIVEKQNDEQWQVGERLHFTDQSYQRIATALTGMVEYSWLTECIDEALIMVDQEMKVAFCNSLAKNLYRELGYVEEVLGQPYENIRLAEWSPDDDGYSVVEIAVGKYFLSVKFIRLDAQDMSFAIVIRDITGIKEQEKELILKSVAIREMHHRVKNNLQTIASLLRLQVRRTNNEETRQVLGESMSRILSIATTHELLARSGVDNVKIGEVIQNINSNTLHYFARPNFNVSAKLEGDDFEVESDLATSVALIINELLQNSMEYAFAGRDKGQIRILVKRGELYSQIQVIDDGVGFDVEKVQTNRLGLSIVQSLVKGKLRGDLSIESGPGGTRTTFSFINKIGSDVT